VSELPAHARNANCRQWCHSQTAVVNVVSAEVSSKHVAKYAEGQIALDTTSPNFTVWEPKLHNSESSKEQKFF